MRRRRRTTPFYQQKWFLPAVQVVLGLGGFALLHVLWPAPIIAWLVDIAAFFVVLAIGLALVSQVVLPVATAEERGTAYSRMWLYVSGGHGPIVFIRDGALLASKEELNRPGEGVLLLDSVSGAVLERGQKFSRAVGPGITFLSGSERIKETLDLRRQQRTVTTEALTRDAIRIETTLTVTFGLAGGASGTVQGGLDDQEGELFMSVKIRPAYLFNEQSAFKAVYGAAVGDGKMLHWTDLPTMVTAEVFRDQIARMDLDQLFLTDDSPTRPLEILQRRVLEQARRSRLLHDRGVQIYNVKLGFIKLPPPVQRQLIDSWRARWKRQSLSTQYDGEVMIERIQEQARAEAQKEILSDMAASLRKAFSDGGTGSKTEIAKRLLSELNRAASDPMVRLMLPNDVLRELNTIRDWAGLPHESDATAGEGDRLPDREKLAGPPPDDETTPDANGEGSA